jgi:hypothetical protein
MTKQVRRTKARAVVLPVNYSRRSQLVFSDGGWERVKTIVDPKMTGDAEILLREGVSRACDDFLSEVRLISEGAATASAVRKPAGKQPSPLEALHKNLKTAARNWSLVKGMHDDRLGVLSDLGDQLEAMASDAERRLVTLRQMKPAKPSPAAQSFIRAVARACRNVGLHPTANGRIYEEYGAATWFQEFIAVLNDNFLGLQGWGAPGSYTRNALFAEVAQAMSGEGK